MKLEREYRIPSTQKTVWESMLDSELLAQILPGCKSLIPTGKDEYVAETEIKVGPVKGRFTSKLKISDKNPPNSYRFHVSGIGSKGHIEGRGEIRLREEDSKTVLSFFAEGNITGIIARIGSRLIEATGKKLLDDGIKKFKTKLKEKDAVTDELS